jgi:TetR/AcrR family transcriptional regulator, transcriptional repressor for nem operon
MSKVSREEAQQNRERVVATAARLFRERGLDGVGIADVMKSAGLTHGAFYAQFPSKEHLMAEACSKSSDDLYHVWCELLNRAPKKDLSVLAATYLSTDHRDNPGSGCVAASLGVDSSRQGRPVRTALTASVKRSFDLLTQLIPGRALRVRRREAIASFAALVGGMVLARGVSDPALSEEILDAVRVHIADMDKARST